MSNSHKGKTGFKRIYNAFFYSVAGIRTALKYEDAFRVEILLAIILIPIAFLISTNSTNKVLLISSVLFVLVIELLNSAIEYAVDHTSLEDHELAKRAKDLGSAAVFMSIVISICVWTTILLS